MVQQFLSVRTNCKSLLPVPLYIQLSLNKWLLSLYILPIFLSQFLSLYGNNFPILFANWKFFYIAKFIFISLSLIMNIENRYCICLNCCEIFFLLACLFNSPTFIFISIKIFCIYSLSFQFAISLYKWSPNKDFTKIP